ncbi:MAG: Hpt domain-containing protein [Bacteroidales bacterium]|nr:Hpt domain-containing protein [Bacteroidales bacterium]
MSIIGSVGWLYLLRWIMEQKYDLSLLKRLSNNDEAFIVDMLNTFRRTAGPIIERMERLVAEKKYEALGREAHKFIPGVSFLGIKYLESDLLKIEENAKTGTDLEEMEGLVSQVKAKVKELVDAFEHDFKLNQ